ncbi:hypothetical protein KUTeg_002520 [Tegillarca granosa]|uniref:Macro domain-containing protein n=1 Tax=Tegillarca granosa TaxID=220873 RepID=A0ABQ9FUK3_TEGGR|nr:hypothetical protein KUTeg_002520 [Tegillarca granosa]
MLPATLSTPEIVANRVAIYKKDEKGICVVGFKDDVIKTYDLVKELTRTDCPCTRQLKINPFESDLLTKLDFIGGSILQLDVDCIVNSANERLGHGAGVSAVIARAAGYKLEEEGKEYIERYGPIPVGELLSLNCWKITIQICYPYGWSKME